MLSPFQQLAINPRSTPNYRKVIAGFTISFLIVMGITICQDLVDSINNGFAFYLSESMLFKAFWLPFIPILSYYYHKLKHINLNNLRNTILLIVIPIVIHLFFVPFFEYLLSVLFYDGRYSLYKFISYTLSHDFINLVVVYAGFVLVYRHYLNNSFFTEIIQKNNTLTKIVINQGKKNKIVFVKDIELISSATPYIYIHINDKKYIHSETLKSMLQQLDKKQFIRIHKSSIVNLEKVKSFTSRLNGDYDLLLKNGKVTRLSRTYAANFKKFIKITPQDTV